MALSTWLRDVEAQVVTIIQQDGDAAGFFGRIESGVVDPITNQELLGADFPYCGVVAISFERDADEVTAYKLFDVGIRIVVADVRTPQQEAQQHVQDGLAHLDTIFGKQRTGARFSLAGSTFEISDVHPGSGRILDVLTNDDDSSFLVLGEYTATVEGRLLIV